MLFLLVQIYNHIASHYDAWMSFWGGDLSKTDNPSEKGNRFRICKYVYMRICTVDIAQT